MKESFFIRYCDTPAMLKLRIAECNFNTLETFIELFARSHLRTLYYESSERKSSDFTLNNHIRLSSQTN